MYINYCFNPRRRNGVTVVQFIGFETTQWRFYFTPEILTLYYRREFAGRE